MTKNPVEIPQAMREQAEQNMKEAHAGHEQFTDLVTKAMDAWKGAMRAGLAAARSKDVQNRAMEIAKKNAESASTPQKFPAPSDNEKPPRRKSAKSKTATSGTITTPSLPSHTPLTPHTRLHSKPQGAKKSRGTRRGS